MILLTGATGYIGGRLLGWLEQQGRQVRCLVRRLEHLKARVNPGIEVIADDVLDPAGLAAAMQGVEAAFLPRAFHEDIRQFRGGGPSRCAELRRGRACRRPHAPHLLGGLGDDRESLSLHLRSRHEVGKIFRQSGVPVVELRASIVLGSGSLSFEMIRTLVERLPVMVTPPWVRVPAQPIGVDDVLAYLVAEMKLPGRAWLEFLVEPDGAGSRITQTPVSIQSVWVGWCTGMESGQFTNWSFEGCSGASRMR